MALFPPLLQNSQAHRGAGHAWSHLELSPQTPVVLENFPSRAASRDSYTGREVEATW